MNGIGFSPLSGSTYLILDRDEICQSAFDVLLRTAGVESVKMAPNSPNRKAFAERCVRSIKGEGLRKVSCVGIGGLERVLRDYLLHRHGERNHQGIGNVSIAPAKLVADQKAPVECRSRLCGVLRYSYRDAA